MKNVPAYALVLMFAFYASGKGQTKTALPKDHTKSATEITTPEKATFGCRNLLQDRKGNIWMPAEKGVFRYDGKSVTNITSKVSSARFISVLEDRKGNLWFGSLGSGVYLYDGKSFRNFTTQEGLAGNDIVSIYEDKTGNIWFGAFGAASRYDGKSFRNFMLEGGSIVEDRTDQFSQNFTKKQERPHSAIISFLEDKTGKLWIGTRGYAFVYDGKTFSPITHNGKPFLNIGSIIADKKGNVWLGGPGGLWRYDINAVAEPATAFANLNQSFAAKPENAFTHFNQDFVTYIYEDKKGNIWTSSQTARGWVLSRYEEKSLTSKKPVVTEIDPKLGVLFGIFEGTDGNIWFCSGGVYRYDGKTFTDFKGKAVQR